MEAKELRIGNYVEIDNEIYFKDLKGFPLMVNSITSLPEYFSIGLQQIVEKQNQFNDRYHQKDEYVKPIELTKEWIEKFLFNTSGVNFYKAVNGYEFIIWTKHIDFAPVGYFFRGTDFDVEIKFVHQLQNLYFVLIGEELTVK